MGVRALARRSGKDSSIDHVVSPAAIVIRTYDTTFSGLEYAITRKHNMPHVAHETNSGVSRPNNRVLFDQYVSNRTVIRVQHNRTVHGRTTVVGQKIVLHNNIPDA